MTTAIILSNCIGEGGAGGGVKENSSNGFFHDAINTYSI
jgi:hypothetical protein